MKVGDEGALIIIIRGVTADLLIKESHRSFPLSLKIIIIFSGIFLPEWAGFLFNFYWNFSRGVTADLLTKESYQSLPWDIKNKAFLGS